MASTALSDVEAIDARLDAEAVLEKEAAEQALTVVLALLQRERLRAEQYYTRARNLLGYTTLLFTGAQAAFLGALSRQVQPGKSTIAADDRSIIAATAAVGLGALVLAVFVLFVAADRPQKLKVLGGKKLLHLMSFPPDGLSPVQAMVAHLADEEESLSKINGRRAKVHLLLAAFCAVAVLAALAELALVYKALV